MLGADGHMASAKRDNEISRVGWREGPSSDLSSQIKPHLGRLSIPQELVCGNTFSHI